MKRILIILSFITTACFAQTKMSDLPVDDEITGSEYFLVVDGTINKVIVVDSLLESISDSLITIRNALGDSVGYLKQLIQAGAGSTNWVQDNDIYGYEFIYSVDSTGNPISFVNIGGNTLSSYATLSVNGDIYAEDNIETEQYFRGSRLYFDLSTTPVYLDKNVDTLRLHDVTGTYNLYDLTKPPETLYEDWNLDKNGNNIAITGNTGNVYVYGNQIRLIPATLLRIDANSMDINIGSDYDLYSDDYIKLSNNYTGLEFDENGPTTSTAKFIDLRTNTPGLEYSNDSLQLLNCTDRSFLNLSVLRKYMIDSASKYVSDTAEWVRNGIQININGSIQPTTIPTNSNIANYTIDLQQNSTTTGRGVSGIILNGDENQIGLNDDYATVLNGESNYASGDYDFIGGGYDNFTNDVSYGVIVNGYQNKMFNYNYGTILNGNQNTISSNSYEYQLIGNGQFNYINSTNNGTILNGYQDTVGLNGNYATIWGSQNFANGYFSTCFGIGNKARTYNETVIGYYAEDITGNYSSAVSTEPLFRIGNGTTSVGRDAFKILKNGDVTITGELDLNDSIILSSQKIGQWSDLDSYVSGTSSLMTKDQILDSLNDGTFMDIADSMNTKIVTHDSTVTFNKAVNVAYVEIPYASTINVDFREGNKRFVDLTGAITINITHAAQGTSTLLVRQDATGRSITHGTGWGKAFPNNDALGSTANYDYMIQFEKVDAVDTANYNSIIEIQ